MQQKTESTSTSTKSWFTVLALAASLAIGWLVFIFIFGDAKHFVDNDPAKEPIDYYGTIHKGGFIVPFLLGFFLIVITFGVERLLTIMRSMGNGNNETFLKKIRLMLNNNDLSGALKECDRQKGSIGNVVKQGLLKYNEVWTEHNMTKEEKLVAIQKELEEATTLELPMLQKNLVVLATIASIATLMGLLGTVIGMIRAFKALASAGAPDAIALSTGISEALINTALGIGTSMVAIILYNVFTNLIDTLTYRIDEAGYSISQSFSTSFHNDKVNA
ncbi:MAG: MotA/TolQ/ExbB proton channel family protein [Bacteroidetes bacterium]|nr:MotA/TolQ/ExbB proton channel family protein [Bacteroidota bacterium]